MRVVILRKSDDGFGRDPDLPKDRQATNGLTGSGRRFAAG
jgi:hypothetical protein